VGSAFREGTPTKELNTFLNKLGGLMLLRSICSNELLHIVMTVVTEGLLIGDYSPRTTP